MDFLTDINKETPAYIWLAIIWIFALSSLVYRSKSFKGFLGEARVWLASKWHLPGKTYHGLHDVILPTQDGTTQIDHIFISRFGIFVVETKHMSGWIYGSELQGKWTQKFLRSSYSFQNPLHQNFKHVKAVRATLDTPMAGIRSVVVFTGNAQFKTTMPANVTQGAAFATYIKTFQEQILSDEEVESAVARIKSSRLTPSLGSYRQHVKRLKNRHDPNAEVKCPRCGSRMVLRTAKRGARAGNQFWGCSAYPKCKGVVNIDQKN